MKIKTILCGAMLLSSMAASSAVYANSALSIFQNSSSEIRVEQIATQITKTFKKSGGKVSNDTSREVRTEILNALESAYNVRHFENQIINSINNSLNSREQQKLLSWFDSPLGRKSALAEAKAMISAFDLGMTITIEDARKIKASAKRNTLLDTIELAAMESELQLDMSVYQTSASSFAANAPKSQLGAIDYQFFYTAASSRRHEIMRLNDNFSRALVTTAYKNFSDTELQALISFWGSPTGTRYSVALRRGINNGFRQANQRLDQAVKNIIANNQSLLTASAEY